MANGDPKETRAYARLPGLDIAVLHRRGARGGEGDEVMIALRTAPPFAALGRHAAGAAADPFLLWMRLAQATWASWLGFLAAASTPPWIGRSD
jgi:hypothetical protein